MEGGKACSLIGKGPCDFHAKPGILRIEEGHDPEEINFAVKVGSIHLLGVEHDDLPPQLGDDMGVGLFEDSCIIGCKVAIRVDP